MCSSGLNTTATDSSPNSSRTCSACSKAHTLPAAYCTLSRYTLTNRCLSWIRWPSSLTYRPAPWYNETPPKRSAKLRARSAATISPSSSVLVTTITLIAGIHDLPPVVTKDRNAARSRLPVGLFVQLSKKCPDAFGQVWVGVDDLLDLRHVALAVP